MFNNFDQHYEPYRKQYALMHPASVPNRDEYVTGEKLYPQWLRVMVFCMFVSAALLSGVHTIPTVYDGISVGVIITETVRRVVSMLSFVAIEMAIFISAYLMRRNRWLAWFILITGGLVALVSNINSVTKAFNAVDDGGKAVAVILGVGAPLMALMGGTMFVIMDEAQREAVQKQEAAFRSASKKYDKEVLSAFQAEIVRQQRGQRQRTGERVSVDVSAPLSVDNARGQLGGQADNAHRLSAGVDKPPADNARERVIAFFSERPDMLNVSARKVAEEIGVGKSLVGEIQKDLRGQSAADSEQG